MAFPDVLECVYSMDNAGMNVVGEHLGYDWNQICDEVREAGFYAEDGDGAFSVYRDAKNEYCSSSKILNEIFVAIFAHYPKVDKIQIVN